MAPKEPFPNKVRQEREARLLCKSELAKKAGISPATLDRLERGLSSRPSTRRNVLFALGYTILQKEVVFP
ncbi:MAG: helix-turn-helix transcriptional regulator [Candidatus Magasanikbacteria bacterium]|nr:helix-turn-helix transcriptional regulator [Candidatus Magasanikbacteria bacterium]